MNYIKLNNIVGWVVFLIAAFVYVSTVEPSTSLWDCGEYITTSYKLEVGHPPGAPVFMMIGRIFSAFVSPENAAYMINVVSALSSAFSILFLFWTITHLAKKIVVANNEKLTDGGIIATLGSGIVGALAYTFTDSFWFSAVEGEVYAMSSFFTAITFWAILKWEENAHQISSDRWIVLIIFLIGLAIGVHMLNLLVIPAVAYVIYFKKYKTNFKGFMLTGIISIAVLGFIQSVFINKSISIAAAFERTFTNSFGAGFNVGTLFFFLFVLGLLGFGAYMFQKRGKRVYHIITMSTIVLVIGYASFAMVVVRSNANPPLDENDPETLPALQAYLGREQYGDWPILKGGYWNSPTDNFQERDQSGGFIKDGEVHFKSYVVYKNENDLEKYLEYKASPKPRQRDLLKNIDVKSFKSEVDAENHIKNNPGYKVTEKYIVSSIKTKRTYDKNKYRTDDEFDKYQTMLPRMWDPRRQKVRGYMFWSGYEGNKSLISKEVNRGSVDQYIPTFGENMSFLFNYQMGWMYWRYFLWNFAGRQNDLQGHNYTYSGDGMIYGGALTRGNWLSGLNFIDNERLGDQSQLPTTMKEDESYNRYYYIPLILGLLGLVFHIIKMPKDAFNIFLLFFFTGLAIVIYLNQRPEEPRERDYAYAASFYAFAVWIGLSVLAIYHWGRNLKAEGIKKGLIGVGAAVLLFFLADNMNGGDMAFGYSIAYMGIVGTILVAVGVAINKATKNEKVLAGAAIVLGLSAPFILASENWDDHDRSGRYFARDIAHNYLNSCGKNAILFCFGDNDTFPLWFAQEVEGYRTDMKVINYSLLSSDWHYSQMKKATYDAPYVETILEEPDYRSGTRDVVYLGDNSTPISARQFVTMMKQNKDRSSIMDIMGATNMEYNTLYVDVDKEAVVKNGLVRPDQVERIVPRIQWKLAGGYISKADLAIIDLLANYKWDRPICFTSSSIQGANRGLSSYLQTEGMTTRLIPVQNPGHDKEKMYKMFMGEPIDINGDGKNDKFEWGGLKNKGIFSDYYTMRMIRGARIHFIQVAEGFINSSNSLNAKYKRDLLNDSTLKPDPKIAENKQKAINILDKHFEELPIGRVKVDDITGYLASLYFKAGDTVKGKKYCDQLAKLYDENLTHFSKQSEEYVIEMIEEIGAFLNFFEAIGGVKNSSTGVVYDRPQYDYEIYNQQTYDQLGAIINSAMAKDNDFYGKIFRNLQDAFNPQKNVRPILPYSFMQQKMPQFFGQPQG